MRVALLVITEISCFYFVFLVFARGSGLDWFLDFYANAFFCDESFLRMYFIIVNVCL
jgi:hypothetical protein